MVRKCLPIVVLAAAFSTDHGGWEAFWRTFAHQATADWQAPEGRRRELSDQQWSRRFLRQFPDGRRRARIPEQTVL
jgi:hypothetical protein